MTVTLPFSSPLLTVITTLVLSAKMALPSVLEVPSVLVEVRVPPSIVAVTSPELVLELFCGLATARALAPDMFAVPPMVSFIGFLVVC